jgi:hypothetical protein
MNHVDDAVAIRWVYGKAFFEGWDFNRWRAVLG